MNEHAQCYLQMLCRFVAACPKSLQIGGHHLFALAAKQVGDGLLQ